MMGRPAPAPSADLADFSSPSRALMLVYVRPSNEALLGARSWSTGPMWVSFPHPCKPIISHL